MEYKLTLFDLKKGKDYFIQLTSDFVNVKRNGIFIWESIINYNGTYTFINSNIMTITNVIGMNRIIIYEFINTKYKLLVSKNLNNSNSTNIDDLKFYGYFDKMQDKIYIDYFDCDITEPTSEYVLK